MVRHMDNLIRWQKEELFRYGGRDAAADALFPNGECAIATALRRRAQPHHPRGAVPVGHRHAALLRRRARRAAQLHHRRRQPLGAEPRPAGGAAGGRSAEEWRGLAEFFRFVSQPDVAAKWHMDTGYVPLTRAAYEKVKAAGYYAQNPGAEVPIEQLLRGGGMTENTRGIRLGGYVEIRNIIQEEMEKAFQGQQNGQGRWPP